VCERLRFPAFLAHSTVVALLATALVSPTAAQTNPFTYGVAARAESDRATLWTRAEEPGTYTAEVATDPTFLAVVGSKIAIADESEDNTIKVVIPALTSSTLYYYRFITSEGEASATGMFTTLSDPFFPSSVDIAATGDSDILWQDHPHNVVADLAALKRVAEDGPRLFVYLADTIYSESQTGAAPALTLEDKWSKYKANRIPATMDLLASTNAWPVAGDQEVAAGYDGAVLTTTDPALMQAGKDAFDDYFPTREARRWRVIDYGSDVDLFFLDERTFRTQSPDGASSPCRRNGTLDPAPTLPKTAREELGLGRVDRRCREHIFDRGRTMLGLKQFRWLKRNLRESDATWKLVFHESPIAQLYFLPYDRWEGYGHQRRVLLRFIRNRGIDHVVFVAAGTRALVGAPVYVDAARPALGPAAYEVVTGPIQACTWDCELAAATGFEHAGKILTRYLVDKGLLRADCAQTNSYGYASLESTEDGRLRVSWKGPASGDDGGRLVGGRDCPDNPVKLP
jgi:phosphodiesterase/alkaline phosphatase D-like protein